MTVGTFTLFSKNKDDLRINDIVGATVKFALVSSAWTPDTSVTGNSLWADMSANEITAANGYSAGGATLASVVATAISNGFKLSSASPAWTASGGNIAAWRYAVMYVSGIYRTKVVQRRGEVDKGLNKMNESQKNLVESLAGRATTAEEIAMVIFPSNKVVI